MITSERLPVPLRGIIPPLIPPLTDRDTLDRAGLERLLERVLSGGVHGLFFIGTIGTVAPLATIRPHPLMRAAVRSLAVP